MAMVLMVLHAGEKHGGYEVAFRSHYQGLLRRLFHKPLLWFFKRE